MKNYVISPSSPLGEATEIALTLLVRNSLLVRKYAGEYHKVNVNAYIRDFMTVRCCAGRRTGNTTAGVKVAKDLFEKPAFMWDNQHMAKMWAKDFGLDSSACGSYNSLNYLVGRPFDCLFMDGISYANPDKVEQAIWACQDNAKLFPDRFTIIQVG